MLNFEALLDGLFNEERPFTEDVFAFFVDNLPINFITDSGATKAVIIPPEENFVIKIPFQGFISERYNRDRQCWEDEFVRYDSAYCSGSEWDYCLSEVEIYKRAVEAGVQQIFAKTEFITTVDGHPIYIQEKAEIFNRGEHSHPREQLRKTREKTKDYYCEANEDWLTDVLEYYGEDIFLDFLRFVDDLQLTDLHSGNLGYINNRPVITDYSGYYE